MKHTYLKFLIATLVSVSASAQTQPVGAMESTKRFFLRLIPQGQPPQAPPAVRPLTTEQKLKQWSRPTPAYMIATAPRSNQPTRMTQVTGSYTPAPAAAPAPVPTPAPTQAQPAQPADSRVGRVYLLTEDKRFFKFNRLSGENEEIVVPKGTRMRLDTIIETDASRSRKSYWNFTVVDSALSINAQPVGAEIWLIRKKIPKELAVARAAERVATAPRAVAPAAPAPVNSAQVTQRPVQQPAAQQPAVRPPPPPLPPAPEPEIVVYGRTVTPNLDVRPEVVETKTPNMNYDAEERLDTAAFFSIKPGKVWAPACTNFLDERGNPGPWGRAVMAKLDDPAFRHMLDATKMTDLRTLCPAYGNFDLNSKKKFWAFFIASMAMSESSCNKDNTGRGPNGTLAGLLQLHLGRESAYGCPRSTNARNPIANVTCGFTMLKNQVIQHGNLFVQAGKTYWHVLWSGSAVASKVSSRVRIARSCQEGMRATPRR